MAIRRLTDALGKVLDRRRDLEVDSRARRVVGRNEDGTMQLLGTDSECVERGPEGPYPDGYVLEGPARPRFESRGTSGLAVLRAAVNAVGLVVVDGLDPATYTAGLCYDVEMTGHGFTPDLDVSFLRPVAGDPHATEPNPDVDLDTVTYVDSQHMTLHLCVDAAATPREGLPVSPGGEYSIGPPVPVSCPVHVGGGPYLAIAMHGDRIWAWQYYGDGTWETTLGPTTGATIPDGEVTDDYDLRSVYKIPGEDAVVFTHNGVARRWAYGAPQTTPEEQDAAWAEMPLLATATGSPSATIKRSPILPTDGDGCYYASIYDAGDGPGAVLRLIRIRPDWSGQDVVGGNALAGPQPAGAPIGDPAPLVILSWLTGAWGVVGVQGSSLETLVHAGETSDDWEELALTASPFEGVVQPSGMAAGTSTPTARAFYVKRSVSGIPKLQAIAPDGAWDVDAPLAADNPAAIVRVVGNDLLLTTLDGTGWARLDPESDGFANAWDPACYDQTAQDYAPGESYIRALYPHTVVVDAEEVDVQPLVLLPLT